MDAAEREWLVTSAAADYHPMAKILLQNPHLAKRKVHIVKSRMTKKLVKYLIIREKKIYLTAYLYLPFFQNFMNGVSKDVNMFRCFFHVRLLFLLNSYFTKSTNLPI